MVVGAIAGGASIGAGVGASSVALMPFNAANTFLGSAFFGYGMILGERYMYQADWPKIQQRLENGEKIENIIQEYTGRFTAVVMAEAKIIFESVTREMVEIIKTSLGLEGTLAGDIIDTITGAPAPETIPTTTTQPPPSTATSGGTTGGVTLPPTEIIQPTTPTPITAFIPPIYNSSNPVAPQSIARVSHARVGAIFSVQTTSRSWNVLKTYSSFTAAFTAMMLAYPSPKYFPVYVGTTVFATRRQ